MDDFDVLNAPQAAAGNGFSEEDPAAAFLAQQESEIAGIENDEGFSILDSGEIPSSLGNLTDINDGAVNGDLHEESNGPSDTYAAISQVDRLQSEPESLRKWREEQLERLALLDANSHKQEAEWKEKAKVDLEEWYCRQDEQLEKTKVNNRASAHTTAAMLAPGINHSAVQRISMTTVLIELSKLPDTLVPMSCQVKLKIKPDLVYQSDCGVR
ncbi:UNVERIFIED_CONTAM: hypothetical protein FKN15_071230 [Acipenser sinensis]